MVKKVVKKSVKKATRMKMKKRGGKVKIVAIKAVPRKPSEMPTRLPADAPRCVGGKMDTDEFAKWLFAGSPYVHETKIPQKARRLIDAFDREMREYWVTITPEVWSRMVQCNKGNRTLRCSGVASIQSDIDKGVVHISATDPLSFAWNGTVASAQHRIIAFLEKGVTITTKVILGLDPKIKLHMDQGASRRVADTLGYMGIRFSFGNAKAASRSTAYDFSINRKRPRGGNASLAERVASRKTLIEIVHELLLQRDDYGDVRSFQDAGDSGSQAAFMRGIECHGKQVEDIARTLGACKFKGNSVYAVYRDWSREFSSVPTGHGGNAGIDESFNMTVGLILAVSDGRKVGRIRDLLPTNAELKDFKDGKPLPSRTRPRRKARSR